MAIPNIVKKIGYVFLFFLLFPLIPKITGYLQKVVSRMDTSAHVAVVPIKGVLLDSSTITRQLHTFFKDDTIKAILLKIESPGSASGTGQAIFLELENLKKEYPKPVISLVENVCASGAYYIASASDHIVSTPSALVGSIGVTLSYFFQFKDFIEQFKIGYVPLHAGEYKNTTNPFTNITPAQQVMLQSVLDDTYDQFASDVARHRNVSLANKHEWAEGRIFTGRQALKLGLVDELGSATQAVKVLKEKALIDTDITWVHPPKPSVLTQLFGGSEDDNDTSYLSSMVNSICATVEQRYNQSSLRT